MNVIVVGTQYGVWMPTYGVWKSSRYFMITDLDPAKESDSLSELESFALQRNWYAPAPALIARRNGSAWVPLDWVRKDGRDPLTPDQPIKYQEVREGKRAWAKHLGKRPTDLTQA